MRSLRACLPAAVHIPAFLILGVLGCRDDGDAKRLESLPPMPRAVTAVRLAAGARPVRWVSPKPLCVVGVDAETLPECASRISESHPDATYREVRGALREPSDSSRGIACLRFSREIPHGDSILIRVGVVDAETVDNFASSSSVLVWFRPAGNADSAWVGDDPMRTTSDVAPMVLQEQC